MSRSHFVKRLSFDHSKIESHLTADFGQIGGDAKSPMVQEVKIQ